MQELKTDTSLQGGDYRIKRKLGQGGFGITYLAEQVMLKREIAIKEFFMKDSCIRDEATGDVSVPSTGSAIQVERYRKKFLKEAQSLASLDHPNIIKVLDVFERHGTVYYSMPFLSGGSLRDIVQATGPLIEKDAIHYIRQIASALKYMHERHICHLDVKPANIIIDGSGNAVLIDFGISKNYDTAGNETSTTPVGMSEGFAPIEQYAQMVNEFSPASDVYALGATLYYLLMGKTPPSAIQISQGETLWFDERVSDSLRMAISRALEFRVKDRPQNMDMFLSLKEPLQCDIEIKRVDQNQPVERQEDNVEEETIIATEPIPTQNEDVIQQLLEDMVSVDGGSFKMGRRSIVGGGTSLVALSNFYISKYQVTQEQWAAVMGDNPSHFTGNPKLPVENVSWEDCQVFIRKLNEITGKLFRLPTEAEWEYAARGGNMSKNYPFAGSVSPDAVAWYKENSFERTHPVGQKESNELGLYDMSGNVWEWCSDWYGDYKADKTVPKGPSSGTKRITRGGGCTSGQEWLKVWMRDGNEPSTHSKSIGFRLASNDK